MLRSLAYLFAILLLAIGSSAEQVVLRPVADTTLVEWLPTNNLGKSTRIRVGTQFVGRSRGLMRFDLSGISSTAKVVYAQLKVKVFYPPVEGDPYNSGGPGGLKLFRQLRSWNEGDKGGPLGEADGGAGASWDFAGGNERWASPGEMYVAEWYFLESAAVYPPQRVDGMTALFQGAGVITDVQQWISTPQANFGWLVYGAGEDVKACCIPDDQGVAREYNEFLMDEIPSRESGTDSPELLVALGDPAAPLAFIKNSFSEGPIAFIEGPTTVRLQSPFADGRIFFTLDGSKPSVGSTRYTEPVPVGGGEVIRAITYSADYSAGGAELPAITLEVLPKVPVRFSGENGTIVIYDGDAYVPFPLPYDGTVHITTNHEVRLHAMPNVGYQFAGWSGDVTGNEANLVVLVDRPMNVIANFVPLHPPGPPLSAHRVDNDWFVLQFSADKTSKYHLQTSSDSKNWTEVTIYTDQTGTVDAILPLDKMAHATFYRLVLGE